MTSIDEPLDSLVTFVRYFTLAFYTGTAKAIIDEICPPASPGWYMGDAPLGPLFSEGVREEFQQAVVWDVHIKAWAAMQIEQKRIRFAQMCSNGGRDPFPSTGFLEPWLGLSKVLGRTPLYLLDAMVKESLDMIGKMNEDVVRIATEHLQTRNALRAFLLPIFNAKWAEADVPPSVGMVPASVLEQTYVPAHPHWRGKVAFPVDVPIGAHEIASICQAVCPRGHMPETVPPGGSGTGLGLYLDATTGEQVINPEPGQAVNKYGELNPY